MIERRIRPDIGVVTEFTRRRESSRLVCRIIRAGVILLMARVAERAIQRIVVVDVAIGALARRYSVGASQWESGAVVIERCIQPRAGVVALIARLGEVRRHVIWVRRSLIVLQVAAHARRSRQIVVIVNVAIRALARRHGVHTRERESCAVVIEGRVQPRTRVVALIAALGEVRSYVVGIRRSLKVLQVAAHAGGAGEVVVVVDVAIRALTRRHGVHSCQRKVRHVVVERRIRP